MDKNYLFIEIGSIMMNASTLQALLLIGDRDGSEETICMDNESIKQQTNL